ncbi:MAG: GLPGLI family protein [Cytophagaceae bacterium]|nr:GLPGLI family protein [Cytophagaceae bacterium]
MRRVLCIVLVCFAFAEAKLHAQDFYGIATYKSRRAVDLKMSGNMSDDMKEQMEEQLKKQFEKEYTLAFTATESLYTENEKLETPSMPASNGVVIKVSQSKDILYKNTRQKKYTRQEDLMGKVFLIQDSLLVPAWTLEKETKNIGDYLCYKATMEKTYTDMEFTTEDEGAGIKKVEKTKTITVWYTPQIPVNNGPSNYFGLPGLILEVQDGDLSLLCSSVILNPNEKPAIEAPTKGKEIGEEEFKQVQKQKMEEMTERMISNRKSGDGHSIQIKIGG